MYKVLVTDKIDKAGIDLLKEKGLEVDVDLDAYNKLKERIKGYDILIVRSRTKVTKEVIDAADKLKIIARAGSGLDNIDVEYAKKKGIKVLNAPDALKISVAELTISLMVAAARLIGFSYRSILEGRWEKVMGYELYGKRLAVIGFGRVGREVARRAKALGMRVIGQDVFDLSAHAKELGVEFTQDMDEAIRDADVVTLHVPLTPHTRNLINQETFRKMKNGVIIVNTARGEIMDYKALYDALESGKVFAAALDVYPEEPPRSEWLLKLIRHPRVIATAHIGAQTVEAQRRTAVEIAQRILEELGLS